MIKGVHPSINYRAPDDTRRTASLTEIDVHHEGVPWLERVDDPQWRVTNPDGTQHVVEWMLFHASDGTARMCRIASHLNRAPQRSIDSEFVIANPDGSDEFRDKVILFTDPDDGTVYTASIQDVRPWPGSPSFLIS